MNKKPLLSIALLVALTACGSPTTSTKVKSMKRDDKQLTCTELLLEMNEAEFYRKMAAKNKGPKLKNILMPIGYISTYMDAEDAVGAADARVEYLAEIYDIMNCSGKNGKTQKVSAPRQPQAGATVHDVNTVAVPQTQYILQRNAPRPQTIERAHPTPQVQGRNLVW